MTSFAKPAPDRSMTLNEARVLQQDTLAFVMNAVGEYGDLIKYKIGFRDVYLLNHPDYVQHVLLDNWRNYGRDTFQFRNFAMVTGDGLLTTHGQLWQKRRRLAQPGFHRRKLTGMADNMLAAVERLAARWHALTAAGPAVIEVDEHMLRLALEIVGQALFSIDFSDQAEQLSAEMLEMMNYVVYRSQNLLYPPTFVPTPRNVRFRRTMNKLDRIVAEMIAERRKRPGEYDDLLDLLMGTEFEDGQPLDPAAIRDEIVTLIIAGYETVASGMSWVWQLLAQNPTAVSGILSEIQAEIPETGMLNFGTVSNLTYLDQVIQEAFRIYPPSWLVTRRPLAADSIGGCPIPSTAMIVISPYSLHRHPDFWTEPELFDPRRFDPDVVQGRHKFAHIPFGGGPHLCIGKPFAMLEAGLTVARLLPEFKLTFADGQAARVDPQVTLRPHNRARMTLSQR